ncbi:MAG: tetratricopeptide repeat protein, partial [Bryobacterales bacterium]|nr:tetratricopeptide repeat protein [Bryobacterales bacterium]
MRSVLSVIVVALAVLATGGSPSLAFHRAQRLRAFPPPNVPYQEAEVWQTTVKQARAALNDQDFPTVLRLMVPFEKLARTAAPARLSTSTYLYLGAAHLGTYRYSEGLRELLEARRLAELTDDRPNLASILALLSNLYLQMSAVPEAEQAASKALEVCDPGSVQMVGLTI